MLTGAGAAILMGVIWVVLQGTIVALILDLILVQFLLIAVNLLRGIEMHKTCNQCEYKANWAECPGLGIITQNIRAIQKNGKTIG